jgi:urease accessory protein UreH
MLAQGGALLLADAWAVGRAARGERWGFHELDLDLVVRDEQGLILKERSVLDGVARDGLGVAEGFPYLATFAAIAPDMKDWDALGEHLFAALSARSAGARFGVSALGRAGVIARLLCPTAPVLDASVRALWATSRRHLFGLDPLRLRKL